MFGSGWRTFEVCNIQNLVQGNKPQDFSFRLVYEEFAISNRLYKHYLFFVRPKKMYTLYSLVLLVVCLVYTVSRRRDVLLTQT